MEPKEMYGTVASVHWVKGMTAASSDRVRVTLTNGLEWTCDPGEAPKAGDMVTVAVAPWSPPGQLPFDGEPLGRQVENVGTL